jgi:sarcosine oxidase
MTSDVIIAGLGAMGSAAAWQLARRGISVKGFDALQPPHALGSTHGGSRVIRETAFEHPRYVPVVRRAYDLWGELGAVSRESRPLLIPTGALYAGVPTASVVSGSRRSAVEHSVPCEELDAAGIRSRWPVFSPDDGMVGLLEHRGGILDPETCVRAMLDAATAEGADLHTGEGILEWGEEEGGVWVRTLNGRYTAKHLVFSTGPWMMPLLQAAGASVWVERVVQHWFEPARDAGALAPGRMPIYLWEDSDGVIFYGFPMLDGAVKCSVHHRGESTTAEDVRRSVTPDEVERTFRMLRRFVPPAAGRHLRSAVCLYTNTGDGDFVIDRHPAHSPVILVSPCSGIGFKFAPAIGEIVADLVEGAAPRFDLTPFSISRFS